MPHEVESLQYLRTGANAVTLRRSQNGGRLQAAQTIHMGVYVHDDNWVSRRGIVLVVLVLFHLMLFWALKSGFAQKVIDSLAPPIVADIINEKKDEEAPPPPPPPKMEIPPVEVPPPVVDITIAPDAPPTNAISNVTDRPPPPPPVVAAPSVLVKLVANPKASQPNVNDYYPPTSIRLEEEGLSRLKVCVGPNGRVKDATVEASSGFPRLDEAAVKVAKMYRFTPQTVNGVPVDACGLMPIRFVLPK